MSRGVLVLFLLLLKLLGDFTKHSCPCLNYTLRPMLLLGFDKIGPAEARTTTLAIRYETTFLRIASQFVYIIFSRSALCIHASLLFAFLRTIAA